MIKRLLVSGVVIAALWVWAGVAVIDAAAPSFAGKAHKVADTITIDSQWTADVWEAVGGPFDCIMSDTCYLVATVSGTALLDPEDKLYIGVREIKTNDGVVVDTHVVHCDKGQRGSVRIPFMFMWVDSLLSETDVIDTLYINAAVGGSTPGERVLLEDVYITIEILDRD